MHALAARGALAAAAIVGCRQYDWAPLRRCTTTLIVYLSNYLELSVLRVTPDSIELNSTLVQFVVSCTLIDAFCGAIPLLWNLSVSILFNLFRLAIIFVALFVLNIARLEAGFVAFAHGVPWVLAHEVVSGLTYFTLLVFVFTRHSWASVSTGGPVSHPLSPGDIRATRSCTRVWQSRGGF